MRPLALTLVALCSLPAVAQDAGPPPPDELVSYCTLVSGCDDAGLTTVEDCLADAPNFERIAGVDHPTCDRLLLAILDRYACQSALSCAELIDPSACAAEANAVSDQVLTGAGVCFAGVPPLELPPTWTCSQFYYGVADGCDCGCGAVDPDCGAGGCGESGCYDDVCEFCYLDGTDVGCIEPGEGEGEGEGEGPAADGGPVVPPGGGCQGCGASRAGNPAAPLAVLFLLLAFRKRRIRRGTWPRVE